MKAISLWQPWATAIALGSKRVETRHWPTSIRGRIAIHAAKRRVLSELKEFEWQRNWRGALRHGKGFAPLADVLPFGAIVATAVLTDCRRSETFTAAELMTPRRLDCEDAQRWEWNEGQMGDFSPGRFGWILEDIKALPVPIPFRGAQGFFDVPDDIGAT